jgi:hypothetical protein
MTIRKRCAAKGLTDVFYPFHSRLSFIDCISLRLITPSAYILTPQAAYGYPVHARPPISYDWLVDASDVVLFVVTCHTNTIIIIAFLLLFNRERHPHVQDILVTTTSTVFSRRDAAAKLYREPSGITSAASLLDLGFERHVLNYLDGINDVDVSWSHSTFHLYSIEATVFKRNRGCG